ncbi:hypothetical protein JCM21900_001909 [Sporobolomyces salmonicolor]
MSASTHQKQAQAAKLFFDTFALGDFEKAAETMSDRMTFVWEMRPASVQAGLALNGKLKKKDVLEFWRKIRTELMKELSCSELLNLVQDEDRMSFRLQFKASPAGDTHFLPPLTPLPRLRFVQGILADGDPFESDQWYHIEFVPGTTKFLKCVELVDSAMVLQHKKRLAEKTAASHHTSAVRN